MSAILAPAVAFDSHTHQMFGAYLGVKNLNLGCAKNHQLGFVNLDMNPAVNPDVLFNLEHCAPGSLPFESGSFDCVLGSHVFEHITNLVELMAELHRILRPGGHVIAVTPYLSSDDAWDSPHHVRAFSEQTWHYFSKTLYEVDHIAHAGFGASQGIDYPCWRVHEVRFVPYPDLLGQTQEKLEFMKRHFRNVVKELHVVLQKPEDVR